MSGKRKASVVVALAFYFGLLIWGYFMASSSPTIEDVQDQLTQTQRDLDEANKLLDQIINERNNDDDPNNDIVRPPKPDPEPVKEPEQNKPGFNGGGASGTFSEPGGPGPMTGSNSDNTPTPTGPVPQQTPAPTTTQPTTSGPPPDPEPQPITPLLPQPICNVSLLGSIVCQ